MEKDPVLADKYWKKGEEFNDIASLEFLVNFFIKSKPLFAGGIHVCLAGMMLVKLNFMTFQKIKPAIEIYDFIKNTGAGEDGWENFFNKLEIVDEIYDEEFYEENKYYFAVIMGNYYTEKAKEDHKYVDFDYEKIALDWYLTATKSEKDDIALEAAKEMLASSWQISKKYAVTCLEHLAYNSEANYLAGMEYLKGDCVEQNYEKAFELISKCSEEVSDYQLAQLYYYGWGTKANICKAIYYFEKVANRFADTHDANGKNDEFELAKCIPFLIQCYYEDLIQNDSVNSLEKLKILAEYHGWKFAARLLHWYFSDKNNLFQDEVEAIHFKVVAENNNETIYIDKCHMKEILEIGLKCNALDEENVSEYLFSCKDHVLWCSKKIAFTLNELAKELVGDSGINVYYFMAKAFYVGDGVEKNKTRAEVYLKQYIDLIDDVHDKKNYPKSLLFLSRILSDKSDGDNEKELLLEYKHRAYEYEYEKEKSQRLYDILNKAKPYMESGDLVSSIPYIEEAVENGYKKDYSFIGLMYLSGLDGMKIDYEKGYKWIKRFFDDYNSGKLELDADYDDIVQIENALGFCMSQGLGVKRNKKLAIKYWKQALMHCPNRRVDIMMMLSLLFYKGEAKFDDNGSKVVFEKDMNLAFNGFQRAAKLNNSDAMFYLAQIYELGEYEEEPDVKKALKWYKKARDYGDKEANDKIVELEHIIAKL